MKIVILKLFNMSKVILKVKEQLNNFHMFQMFHYYYRPSRQMSAGRKGVFSKEFHANLETLTLKFTKV